MKTLARSATVVASLTFLVATTAAPATAKGPVGVDVTGHGVDTTLEHYTATGEDVDLGSLSEAARIFDIYSDQRPAATPDVAEDDLGARYVLTWDLGEGEIVQHAYPFAEGGAWVHYLPDQEMFGRPVADGWAPASSLTDQLVALGAVDRQPAEQQVADQPAEQPAEPQQVAALLAAMQWVLLWI